MDDKMAPAENNQAGLDENATILVVEDEVIIRLGISDFLRERGLDVLEASNAEEAIRILKSGRAVSLVFTDIRMPGSLDGLDLARYVRKHHPAIPVLMTSGHLTGANLPDEFGSLIGKPYRPELILIEIYKKIGSND